MKASNPDTRSARSTLQQFLQFAGLCLTCTTIAAGALAAPPLPFAAEYEASYSGLMAGAERHLKILDNGQYEMGTTIKLKLFGNTITSISEHSTMEPESQDTRARPLDYYFSQTGVGSRTRQISFDWERGIARAAVDGRENIIALEGDVTDSLSAYLEIRRQLMAGNRDISFPGIEKGELKTFRFQVQGEETISTPAGIMATVRLEKVREPGNERHTDLWLAPDWDYMLVKLIQDEPDAGKVRLDLKEATMDGRRVSGTGNASRAPSGQL